MAMLIVMPMMGMPAFGGAAATANGSLIGHLVYGAIVGGIYGQPREAHKAHAVHA